MKKESENYIKQNYSKTSMLDMSKNLGISYRKVRDFMIENKLTVSKTECYKIRSLKMKKAQYINKPWNWDALP